MAFIISEACIDIKDKECMVACPVDCIYEGDRMLYIDPTECIDCGSCEPVCPTNAIYEDVETPAKSLLFIDINKEFFEEFGHHQGASNVDLKGKDHEYVRNYNA